MKKWFLSQGNASGIETRVCSRAKGVLGQKKGYRTVWFNVIILLMAWPGSVFANVTITAPTLNISTYAYPSAYQALGNIVITEGANTDFLKFKPSKTLLLTAPSGFEFQAGVGGVSSTSADITSMSLVVNASSITVTYSTANSNTVLDVMTISGIMVRSTANSAGASLFSGGSTGTIANVNHGTTVFATFSSTLTEMKVPASGNNSFTTCSGNLYDVGGSGGNYTDGCNGYSVLYPSTAGNMVQISGTFETETNYDYVRIYNGVGTGGTLLGTYSGAAGTIPATTSYDATGALTICFYSDYSSNSSGFNLSISCIVPSPMNFSSCTSTQTNTTTVLPGATSQEILGVQVVTTGSASPLTASSFTFNTNGSTSASNIANAKLWTSGTTSTFTSLTPLGSATVSPSGSFIITGGTNMPYTLASGTNYFWLTYDIVASPTLGDVVDAECTSITVTSAQTPTVSAPGGGRAIVLSYCNPAPTSVDGDGITNVTCGTINNSTGIETNNYGDYSAQSTTIPQGENATVNITYSTGFTYDTKIWVDWNLDGDFEDVGEEVYSGTSLAVNPTTLVASFTVPVATALGYHRMRIGGQDNGPCIPCYDGSYGSYEDYSINVTPAVPMSYVSCTATQTNTNVISTGNSNQEIICMKVVASGASNPLSVSEFRMRTDGTTAVATDIRNAKIWFTGNLSTFTASNQFGTAIANPPSAGVDMVFTGSQELSSGTNYFWLTYDVPSTAVNGNFADATFQSLMVASITQTPSVSAPTEKREIIRGCFYTLKLTDEASDGWNGGKITVKVNNVARLTDVTLASGSSDTFSFIAESGQTITTEYTAGSYPSENSYFITNPNGAYVMSSGEAQTPPENKTATADCNAVKQFTTNVDTYQSGTSCFILTEAKESQKGSVWSNYKIDMTRDFSIDFEVYMGSSDGGADGVVFALQGSCTSAGGNGNSMGFGGIENSLGVEFDTYTNSENSDLSADHIAIISNGSANHGGSDNLAGPLGLSNTEDGAWHSAKVSWNATSQTFKIKYGSDSLTYTGDIVTNLLAGNSQVFWGFTGATGMFYNTQKVCITSYPQNSTQVRDTAINAGTSVNVQAATGASSYTWIPDDGSVSNAAISNPVLTPAVTTEYTCLLEDGCGKMITNKFTVQVISTLPLVLVDFAAVCQPTGVELRWQTASEHNNEFFVLERSTDLVHFTKVAQIQGAANSTSKNNYHFTDLNAQGVTYYRLSQVDFDGKRTYFNPIASDCSTAAKRLESILLYPNPASEWFSLGLPVGVVAKIQILNIAGMIVSERKEVTSVSQIEVGNLANGVYMVKVQVGDEIYYCKMNKH